MTKHYKAPDDGKNLEREAHDRYCTQSGQSSIHGDTLLEFQTQESQSFAFYADKGEGKSDEAVDAEFKEVDEEKDKS